MMKLKNAFVMFIFSAVIGAIIGAVIWGFLRLMNLGIHLLWHTLPEMIANDALATLWPLLLCGVGGVIIGILQKVWGPYPEDLQVVMAKKKKDGVYPYDRVPQMLIAAMLPLLFGAALGPEAGLTGVIVGLCCWAGDNFKFAGKTLPELSEVGFAATLSVLFGSPLFGFVMPVEEDIYSDREVKLPKNVKMFATFCAIFGGLAVCMLLGHIFGGGAGLPRFADAAVEKGDILMMFPVVLIGVVYGLLFKGSEILLHKITAPLRKYPVVLAVVGGLLLGAVGMFFPITMFSGEHEMAELMGIYTQYTAAALFVIAAVKMILINVCLSSGWRGGHFFPAIFAGVCVGYACALVMPIDPVFSCAVATAAVMTTVMRKPIAVAMLLMLCFPVNCLFYLIAASFLAALVPDILGGKKYAND